MPSRRGGHHAEMDCGRPGVAPDRVGGTALQCAGQAVGAGGRRRAGRRLARRVGDHGLTASRPGRFQKRRRRPSGGQDRALRRADPESLAPSLIRLPAQSAIPGRHAAWERGDLGSVAKRRRFRCESFAFARTGGPPRIPAASSLSHLGARRGAEGARVRPRMESGGVSGACRLQCVRLRS